MIRVSGLWAGYGGLDILRGVDIDVEPGSITCIVGPNGAGKSTLLKTISGILRPRAGTVMVDGVDLTGQPPTTILRAGIVQVPQRQGLFTRLSVRQNVLMGGYVARRNSKHLEERYQELAQMFPLLADRGSTSAGDLSGGQRRMVEFARAMILQPRLVLLDEPTLGLDPLSVNVIRASIEAMNGAGTTILMVEQNVRFGLSLAHHATVMSAGSVAMTGTAEDIGRDQELMSIYFGAAHPSRHDEAQAPIP